MPTLDEFDSLVQQVSAARAEAKAGARVRADQASRAKWGAIKRAKEYAARKIREAAAWAAREARAAAKAAKHAACEVLLAPVKLLLLAAKGALYLVAKILNAAKEALKKVTQALAWTMNKMKDGIAAAKHGFILQYLSVSATLKKDLLKSSISAEVKVVIFKKLHTFKGTINLSMIAHFVTFLFHEVVKLLSKIFENYTAEQVIAFDEAQMIEMFTRVD